MSYFILTKLQQIMQFKLNNNPPHLTGIYGSHRDGIHGACPPMIIHSHQADVSVNEDIEDYEKTYSPGDPIFVAPRFGEGLADPNAGPKDFFAIKNPCGFAVRATKNGSMTQDKFFDFCVHYVNNKKAGGSESPEFLYLDGHSSRWNLPGLRYLISNGVHPFFLPSHTSVWTQPNDNGPNYRFHKCVDEAMKRLRNSGAKNTVAYYNVVLWHAWLDFLRREREELLNAGANCTTSCWAKTGLYPFNPHPEAWRNVLSTLGRLNNELKKEADKDGVRNFEIRIKEGVNKDTLTKEEQQLLQKAMPGASVDPTDAAYYQMRSILATWRDSPLSS